MLSFECDYNNGAHPLVLQRLLETNDTRVPGYGVVEFCESARAKIRAACSCPDAQVELIVGGTQTNAVVIATMLHDYEGVVSAQTGHVSAHEAGAIEYTGHEVLTIPQVDGKISADVLANYIETFYADSSHEHMVYPGMVYISHPTEYGTLYTKKELTEISAVCRRWNIPLFMDGARLGYGLTSLNTDVTLADIAQLCDVFYIGGTKVGALCGEAVVFTKNNRPAHFTHSIKKRGALLAKGRLLGVQFDALFTDDLYMKISAHAIEMAEELKAMFRRLELPFFLKSDTNQQFIILENSMMEKLARDVNFSFWEKYDDQHTVVRFCTSWATQPEELAELDKLLTAAKG